MLAGELLLHGLDAALDELPDARRRAPAAVAGSREVWFGGPTGRVEVPVVGREALRTPAVGPLLAEEFDTTTVVPPGWRAWLDEDESIVLEDVR